MRTSRSRLLLLMFVFLVLLDLFNPVNGWRRRRRRRPPPPPPCTCHLSNPAIDHSPYGLVSGGAHVCSGTSYRSEMYCTSCHCGSCPAYRTQAYSILQCCRGYSKSGNTCPNAIPCSGTPFVQHSSYEPIRSSYAVGSTVTFTCNAHYTMSGSRTITCNVGPSWTSAPSCNPTPCTAPPIPAHAYVSPSQTRYAVGSTVNMVCNAGYRQTSGDASKTCQLANRWTGAAIVCKPVCFGWIDSCQNGGVCTSPNFCSNCKDGFHSPKCDPCPKITNCKLSVCSHPDPAGSVTCRTCMYDFGPTKGRAYEPSPDGKTCLKRCSWRADSTPCYPGTCGLVGTCKCAPGFASPATHCRTITTPAKIGSASLSLVYGSKLAGQRSLVNVTDVIHNGGGLVYSNADMIKEIVVNTVATFLTNRPQAPPYIVRSSFGLETYQLQLTAVVSTGTKSLLSLSPSMRESSGLLKNVHQVSETVDVNSKLGSTPLASNDKFRFLVKTKNGGFVTVHDPEKGTEQQFPLTGVLAEQNMELGIDRQSPYHCSTTSSCPPEPLLLQSEITKDPNVVVTWKGWMDTLSKVGTSHLTVAEQILGSDNLLTTGHGEHHHHSAKTVTGADGTTTVQLPTDRSSVYEVKLVVCDRVIEKLKNCKPVHRYVLFDNGTSVSVTTKPMLVTGQVANAGLLWLTKAKKSVQLEWLEHFENKIFVRNGLLKPVKTQPGYDGVYEHLEGKRNIRGIKNKNGIVKFQVQTKKAIAKLLGNPDPNAWNDVGDKEKLTISYDKLGYRDGDSVRLWVKAIDAAGNWLNDSITLHVDSSPPVISNFSLADLPDVRVAAFKDLFKLKIRFSGLDRDSGIFRVEWVLYDNYTQSNLVHGKSSHGNQRYPNLQACRAAHPADSCYVTNNGDEAFSSRFEIQLTKDGNLMEGLDTTQHNHDLQFLINITNMAGLVSQAIYQMSIDTSGPAPGNVLDGLKGEPEKDFQQDLKIFGHWDGFMDKESGIAFYKYKFGSSCYTIKDFSPSSKTNKTTASSASWIAPGPGKYHLTVVAYNNALQPSVPVCSNGNKIVNTSPVVSMIKVQGAKGLKGLLRKGTEVYLITEDRVRVALKAASEVCKQLAAPEDKLDLALVPEQTIPHRPKPTVNLTDEQCREIGPARSETSLAFNDLVNVSFAASDHDAGIRNTEVLLRDASGTQLARQDTRGHVTAAFPNPNLHHGARFFVIVLVTNHADLKTTASIGPIVVNERAPAISDSLEVKLVANDVLITWPVSAISDSVSPFPLSYQLAIENEAGAPVLAKKAALKYNAKCPKPTKPTKPTCTVVPEFSKLGPVNGKNYYFAVLVRNVAGHSAKLRSTSFMWRDPGQKVGVLKFVDPAVPPLHIRAATTITAQSNTSALQMVWFGYHVTEAGVTRAKLSILEVESKAKMAEREVPLREGTALFSSLKLTYGKNYVAVFEIVSRVGTSKSQSGSVWIHKKNQSYADVSVHAGKPCDSSKPCSNFQASKSDFFVSWTLPAVLKGRAFQTKVSLFVGSATDASLSLVAGTTPSSSQQTNFTFSGLSLISGRPYRAGITFVTGRDVDSKVHLSQKIWIAATPPLPQSLSVKVVADNKITFTFTKFAMKDFSSNQHDEYMELYEQRLFTASGGTKYQTLKNLKAKGNELVGNLTLPAKITSFKCTTLAIRGVSKAHLAATIERRVKDCGSGPDAVRPSPIIEAIGPLDFPDTFVWPKDDIDYIKLGDTYSAVWPSLRYGSYQAAVLVYSSPNAPPFAGKIMKLKNPCDDKNVVYCGQSKKRGVNLPSSVHLAVGKTYIWCIHANSTVVGTGSGREVLPEASFCSDGVTVLPAEAGRTGQASLGPTFQRSSNLLVLKWSKFFTADVYNTVPNHSPIKSYYYKIGTKTGTDNVVRSTKAGLATQVVIPQLHLFNGETYCATVEAINVVEVNASATSPCVRIDLRKPQIISASNLTIDGARHNYLSDVKVLVLRWKDVFVDAESGICSYQWCVGTDPKFCDAVPPRTTTATSATENLEAYLFEGHSYHFSVRAIDCVGHSTPLSSALYTFVKSGPQVAQVFDGLEEKDIDHQKSDSELSAHWPAFVDPFTEVVEYFVQVGTVPGGSDVISKFSVGLHLKVNLTHLMLRFGVRYYTSVTACNVAALCSTSVSDGVIIDITPPTLGRVVHGQIFGNRLFQSSRRVIEFRLAGFADQESGLDYIRFSAGTAAARDDVVPARRMPFEPFVRVRLSSDLPLGVSIFLYVTVGNHVGLEREAKSIAFIVDNTAPVFTELPTFNLAQHSLAPNTQISASTLSLKWRAVDAECAIERVRISVFAHKGAAPVIPPKVLRGFDMSSYTLTKLKLLDGYSYRAAVESCNAANLCTKTETAKEVKIDNSPPELGMFMPRTNASFIHDGYRNMTWTGSNITVSCQGFSDPHTDVRSYFLTVGSIYLGNDLLQNGRMSHKKSALVQTATFKLRRALSVGKKIYMGLRAMNGAGEMSRILHAAFIAHADGHLDLVRRCDSESCLGHCVCAPQDQTCAPTATCTDKTNTGGRRISVKVITVLGNPASAPAVAMTPEPCYLAASWTTSGGSFQRFEVSAGLSVTKDQPNPGGVFDPKSESVWHDVGQDNWAVLNFKQRHGKCLKENTRYKFFVRGWHDANSYSTFYSDDVMVLVTAMQVMRMPNSRIREVDPQRPDKDLNFVGSSVTSVLVAWPHQFRERLPGSMTACTVGLGSFCGAGNIAAFTSLPASTTQKKFTGLRLQHGHRVFSSVRCCDRNDLCAEACSNGFVIDHTAATTGTLLNSFSGLWNKCFQSNATHVAATFKGFFDSESFVSNYEWCIGRSAAETDCSLQAWLSVGLHTHVRTHLSSPLAHADTVFMRVRAANQVPNSRSAVVTGCRLLIDRTPPYLASGCTALPGRVTNGDFTQASGASVPFSQIKSGWWKTHDSKNAPAGWRFAKPESAALLVTSTFSSIGRKFVLLKGSLAQNINTVVGRHYVLVLHVADVGNWQGRAMRQGFVNIGTIVRRSFEIQARRAEHRHIQWSRRLFFFRATETVTSIEFGTFPSDVDGLGFDAASLRECRQSADGVNAIHADIEQVGEFSRLHAAFSLHDSESQLAEIRWALGFVQGGVQLFNYHRISTSASSVQTPLVRVPHGTNLHFTLLVVNHVGLGIVRYAAPIVVDFTPPVIIFSTMPTPCEDGCILSSGKFEMTLHAKDPESHVRYCSYALGSGRSLTDLQDFKTIYPVSGKYDVTQIMKFEIPSVNGRIVYPMVLCINERGMSTTRNVYNGYRIVTLPPSATLAQVKVVTEPPGHYQSRSPYQAQTHRLVFTWDGFFDNSGAEMTYEFAVVGPKNSPYTEEWRSLPHIRLYILEGLRFVNGATYIVKVRAVGASKLVSAPASAKVIIDSTPPAIDKGKLIVRGISSDKFQVDWSAVFKDEAPMYFELAIGSGKGKTDVFGFIETKLTSITVKDASPLKVYHFIITAVNDAGLYTRADYKLFKFKVVA